MSGVVPPLLFAFPGLCKGICTSFTFTFPSADFRNGRQRNFVINTQNLYLGGLVSCKFIQFDSITRLS